MRKKKDIPAVAAEAAVAAAAAVAPTSYWKERMPERPVRFTTREPSMTDLSLTPPMTAESPLSLSAEQE